MAQDTKVVRPYYLIEQAYRLGYDETPDLSNEPGDRPLDIGHITETAHFINVTDAHLRSMAGFAGQDSPGKPQQNQTVAAIKAGCEEDRPSDATLMKASQVYDMLFTAWKTGVYDAGEGKEPDIDRIPIDY